jgi:serine/threonine protein kinase
MVRAWYGPKGQAKYGKWWRYFCASTHKHNPGRVRAERARGNRSTGNTEPKKKHARMAQPEPVAPQACGSYKAVFTLRKRASDGVTQVDQPLSFRVLDLRPQAVKALENFRATPFAVSQDNVVVIQSVYECLSEYAKRHLSLLTYLQVHAAARKVPAPHRTQLGKRLAELQDLHVRVTETDARAQTVEFALMKHAADMHERVKAMLQDMDSVADFKYLVRDVLDRLGPVPAVRFVWDPTDAAAQLLKIGQLGNLVGTCKDWVRRATDRAVPLCISLVPRRQPVHNTDQWLQMMAQRHGGYPNQTVAQIVAAAFADDFPDDTADVKWRNGPRKQGYAWVGKLVLDVLRGLEVMHASGWVHADVKIENVLYDAATHTFAVSDFGIAFLSAVPLPPPSSSFAHPTAAEAAQIAAAAEAEAVATAAAAARAGTFDSLLGQDEDDDGDGGGGGSGASTQDARFATRLGEWLHQLAFAGQVVGQTAEERRKAPITNFNHLFLHAMHRHTVSRGLKLLRVVTPQNVHHFRCFLETFAPAQDFYNVAGLVWRLFSAIKSSGQVFPGTPLADLMDYRRNEFISGMFPPANDPANVAAAWPYVFVNGTMAWWKDFREQHPQKTIVLQFHTFMRQHSFYCTTHARAWDAAVRLAFGTSWTVLHNKPNDAVAREVLESQLTKQGSLGSFVRLPKPATRLSSGFKPHTPPQYPPVKRPSSGISTSSGIGTTSSSSSKRSGGGGGGGGAAFSGGSSTKTKRTHASRSRTQGPQQPGLGKTRDTATHSQGQQKLARSRQKRSPGSAPGPYRARTGRRSSKNEGTRARAHQGAGRRGAAARDAMTSRAQVTKTKATTKATTTKATTTGMRRRSGRGQGSDRAPQSCVPRRQRARV